MKQYALGLDFGTLSVRALFLDLQTGEEAGGAEFIYPHGVMTECLPDGTVLPPDFALEHPQDFLMVWWLWFGRVWHPWRCSRSRWWALAWM